MGSFPQISGGQSQHAEFLHQGSLILRLKKGTYKSQYFLEIFYISAVFFLFSQNLGFKDYGAKFVQFAPENNYRVILFGKLIPVEVG